MDILNVPASARPSSGQVISDLAASKDEDQPKATSISTIVVQSSGTRIVIALVMSKQLLDLKICEMVPSPADIGYSLSEALIYQNQHEMALKKLESKQTPVEKLLSQADDIIASQKADPIVFSAMAENLANAWKNLTLHLQQRRKTLDQSVSFYKRCEEFAEQIEFAQTHCNDGTSIVDDLDTIKKLIDELIVMKKSLLEAAKVAMNEKKSLITLLNEMKENNLHDSRPIYMHKELLNMINYVGNYLDRLQDKRNEIVILFKKKITGLQIQYSKCKYLKQLDEINNEIKQSKNMLNNLKSKKLTSKEEVNLTITKLDELKKSVQILANRIIHMVREEFELDEERCSLVKEYAFILLEENSNLMTFLEDGREVILLFGQFLECYNQHLSKLNSISDNIVNTQANSNMGDLMVKSIQESVMDINEKGNDLLNCSDFVKDSFEEPVKCKLQEIHEKANKLLIKIGRLPSDEKGLKYDKFYSICDDLERWLDDNVCDFMKDHQYLGSNQAHVIDFYEKHRKLSNQLQTRSMEVNALFNALNQFHSQIPTIDEQLRNRVDDLRLKWTTSGEQLERRIILSQRLTNIHKIYNDILKKLDELSIELHSDQMPDENCLKLIQDSIVSCKQDLLKVNNLSSNFISDIKDCKDSYLDIDKAVSDLQNCLYQLDETMTKIEHLEEVRQNRVDSQKWDENLWSKLCEKITQLEDYLNSIATLIYPILGNDNEHESAIFNYLAEKQASCRKLFEDNYQEIDNLLSKVKALECPSDYYQAKEDMLEVLLQIRKSIQDRECDFKRLMNQIINIFGQIIEIQTYVDDLEKQELDTNDLNNAEDSSKTLDATKTTILELIKLAEKDNHNLSEEIDDTEGSEVASCDSLRLASILENLKERFLTLWNDLSGNVEMKKQFLQFHEDLGSLNEQLEELSIRLKALRSNFGGSFNSAKQASFALRQFAKIIELLEQKIASFCKLSSEIKVNDEDSEKSIELAIDHLKERWTSLIDDATETHRIIDLLLRMYQLIDEHEIWIKDANRKVDTMSDDLKLSKSRADEILKVIQGLQSDVQVEHNRWKKIKDFANQMNIDDNQKQILDKSYDQLLIIEQKLNSLQELAKHAIDGIEIKEIILSDETIPLNQKTLQATQISIENDSEELICASFTDSRLQSEDALRTAESLHESILHEAIKDAVSIQIHSPELKQLLPKKESNLMLKLPKSAPKIVKQLINQEISKNLQLVMECIFESEIKPKIEWFKDGKLIDSLNNRCKISQFDDGKCTLIIENVDIFDAAIYQCQATSCHGSVVCECKISIKPDVDDDKDDGYGQTIHSRMPIFTRQLSSAMVFTQNDVLKLECQIVATPEAQTIWKRDGNELMNDDDIQIEYKNGKAFLLIKRAKISDAGLYTCTASNQAGKASSSCKVIIDAESDETFDAKEEEDEKQKEKEKDDEKVALQSEQESKQAKSAKLSIIKQLQNQTIIEGNSINLEVNLISEEKPKIIWLFDDKIITEKDDRITLIDHENRYILRINRGKISDSGRYQFVATLNTIKVSSECDLIIKPKTASTFSPDKSPYFVRNLTDMSVDENSTLFISCSIAGHPIENVIWFRNDEQIYCSNKQEISEDMESKTYSLIVQNVKSHHSGQYSVKANNYLGQAESTCRVHVLPKLTKAPQFLVYLENKYVQSNDKVELKCKIEASPEPKIIWYFNQNKIEPFKFNNIIMQKDAAEYSLIIDKISVINQGNYCVVAENEHGKAVSSANVIVSDPIQSETNSQPFSSHTSYNSNQDDSNSIARSTFHQASRSFRLLPSTSTSPSSASPSSMVPNMTSPKPFKSNYQVPSNQPQTAIKEPHEYNQFKNSLSQNYSTYQRSNDLLKPAIDMHGKSVDLNRAFITTGNTATTRGCLKIEKNLMNKIVRTGDEVIFEAEIIGHPSPTVLWYRNGVLMQQGTDWKMVKDANMHKLIIREAFPEDTGLISIKAYNSTGSVESSANLLVRDTNLEVDQIPVTSYAEECSSVKQKREFFTKFVMDNSSTSSKIRSISLERPTKQLPVVPPKPFRVVQLARNNVNNYIKPADSYESLPYGYRYSSASSRSDISESCYTSNQEDLELKPILSPVWSPKGSQKPKPRWRPVKPPSSSNSKTISMARETGTSLQSTTLSFCSMSRTESPTSVSIRPQDISFHPEMNKSQTRSNTSDTMSLQAPIFLNGLKDVTISEGSYLSLECEVDGFPPPTIKWYHNDLQIASVDGKINSHNGGICRLIIEKTSKEATGKYQCTASNSVGSITTSCYLRVLPNPVI